MVGITKTTTTTGRTCDDDEEDEARGGGHEHGGHGRGHGRGIPTPPDGGWGWMVVFGSFMIHVIADGVTYTFGIFFVELSQYYNEGKGATAWIASILVGITLGAGPIASALTNKYGCRPVTIAGAVLASVGLVLSLLAPNITTLYFTIGVCAGLGFGLIYLPAIVSVTCYFEKRRAFATGIAVCGSGLGTFIFAPLLEFLVETYLWQGAMLLVAGIVLNCTVFGALFRPLKVERKKVHIDLTATNAEQQRLVNGVAVQTAVPARLMAPPPQPQTAINGHLSDTGDGMRMCASAHNLMHSPSSGQVLKRPASHRSLGMGGSNRSLGGGGGVGGGGGGGGKLSQDESSTAGPLYRKDVFYSGSLLNLPQYRSNPQMYAMSVSHIPRAHDEEGSPLCKCMSCSNETRDTLREMMDLSLLKDPIFVLFAVSNFCTSIGFNVPYVYMKDRALLLGMSRDESSFLLAIIGIANTISRVFLGYISDKPWLNRLWLYNSSLTICGLGTMFSAFCLDYTSMAFYAAVFGATAGAYVGLTSVILVDLLGLEKLTNAFGLLLLFQGAASLIGPPIAGWLYDALESYDPGFYVAGAMIAISGTMLFAIPAIRWCQKKGKATTTTTGGGGGVATAATVECAMMDSQAPQVTIKIAADSNSAASCKRSHAGTELSIEEGQEEDREVST